MSDATHEREILEEGTATEFWRVVGEYVTREWGPSGIRFQQAVQAAAKSQDAVSELQKVLHTQEQMLWLLRWPNDRVAALKSQVPQPTDHAPSRRGPFL